MEQRKLVTVAWKECCKSLEEGGLGIQPMSVFNSTTKLHLCWNFAQGKQEWNTLLDGRVKRNNRIIAYHIKSSIWTSIKACYNKVMDNTKWVIGNGASINFSLDNWLDAHRASKLQIPEKFHGHMKVMIKVWLVGQQWFIPANVHAAFPSLI